MLLKDFSQEIFKEINPTKNPGIDFEKLTHGNKKKLYWICEKGHEWEASCNSRTNKKCGCPYCSGHKTCQDNCLKTTHPDLSKEWDYEKNNELTPKDFVAGSNKKVWWICSKIKTHKWEASIAHRTYLKSKCPYCYGDKICNDNCLETKFPDLSKEWDYKKNGNLTPKDFLSGSKKKVWWICEKKHEWDAIVKSRTGKNKTGCPCCCNKKVCEDNCLETVFPKIALEWDYEKNGDLIPKNIVFGSQKKVFWKCNKGHEWEAKIVSRTGINKTGCPICNESHGEKEITRILIELKSKNKIKDFQSQFKNKKIKNKFPLPFDFKIELNNEKILLIEYQGKQHYKKSRWSRKTTKEEINKKFIGIKKRDKIKKIGCKKLKIPLLVIKYTNFYKIEKIVNNFIEKYN